MKKKNNHWTWIIMRVIFFIIPVIIAAISVLKQPLCTSPLGSKAEMKFETFVKLLLLNESYESALKWISKTFFWTYFIHRKHQKKPCNSLNPLLILYMGAFYGGWNIYNIAAAIAKERGSFFLNLSRRPQMPSFSQTIFCIL